MITDAIGAVLIVALGLVLGVLIFQIARNYLDQAPQPAACAEHHQHILEEVDRVARLVEELNKEVSNRTVPHIERRRFHG